MGVLADLVVRVRAQTAGYNQDMDGVGDKAKKTGKDVENSLNKVDLSEGRGTIMLLGEDIGLHLPRHVQTFLAELPGVATALSFAFAPLAIITIGLKIFEFTEHLKKLQEELDQQAQKVWASVDAIEKMGEATDVSNLKLQDEINLLMGVPAVNGPAEAAIEARKKVDDLVASLDKAIEEENSLMEKLAGNWFSQAVFSDGWVKTLASEFHGAISFVQIEIRNLENAVAASKARVQAEKDAGKDTTADQAEVDRNQKTLDEKRAYLMKYLTDKSDATTAAAKFEAEKVKQIQALTADSVSPEGELVPGISPEKARKQVDEQSAALQSGLDAMVTAELNAAHVTKGIRASVSLVKKKEDLEDAARADAITTKALQDDQHLADSAIKTEESKTAAKMKAAAALPQNNAAQVEARMAKEREAVNEEAQIESKGLDDRLARINTWWSKVDQTNKKNQEQHKVLLGEYNNALAKLTQDGLNKQAEITNEGQQKITALDQAAHITQTTDLEKTDAKQIAQIQEFYSTEAKANEESANRGLMTRDTERKALALIYEQEKRDIRAKIADQIAAEEQLRAYLQGQGRGEGDPAYQASLQRTINLRNADTKAVLDFNKAMQQVNQTTKSAQLTGLQFAQQMDTNWKNTAAHIKSYWQDAINQINSGTVSAFNTMLETGKGFGDSMKQVFGKILEGFLDLVLEMALEWIETQILMKIFGTTTAAETAQAQIAASAAAAGAAGVASAAAIPLIGWSIAPEAGQLDYFSALAFASVGMSEGGKIPFDNFPANLHEGEVVVPKTFVQEFPQLQQGQGTPKNTGRSGMSRGHTFNIHMHDVTDGAGVQGMVQKHVIPMLRREAMRGRL